MRKTGYFLLAAVLWAANLVYGQTAFKKTVLTAVAATGASASSNVSDTSLSAWKLVVYTSGAPTGCVIALQSSNDNSSFSNITAGAGTSNPYTCTSDGQVVFLGTARYLRANLTTLSGGASPTVTAILVGMDSSNLVAQNITLTTQTVNGLLTVNGNETINQLATPSVTSVTPQTAGGAKNYSYKIVAKLGSTTTAASAAGSTADGGDDLSLANRGNVIVWGAVTGATSGFDVYRTVAGGTVTNTTGLIASVGAGTLTYTDIGVAGDASSPPTANGTGLLTLPTNGLVAGTNQLVLSGGNVGIGTAAPVGILHSAVSSAVGAQATLEDTRAFSSTPQASVDFLEAIDAAPTKQVLAQLIAGKENATSGNNAGVIRFQTRPNLGSLTEVVRIASGGNVGIGTTTATSLLALGGDAARTFQMERHSVTNTAGNNLTLLAGGATSGATDKAGGALVFQPGLGTGSGVPALTRIQQDALGTAAGTADHNRVDRFITGASKVLVNNTNTALVNATIASNTVVAGIISYAVEVFDGTDVQVEEGKVSYHATNKAAVIANNTTVKYGNQQAATIGTLTVTWTITAANPAVVTINANSSLVPSAGYPRVTYSIENLTQQAVAVQ